MGSGSLLIVVWGFFWYMISICLSIEDEREEEYAAADLDCDRCGAWIGEFWPEDEGSAVKCPNCEKEVTVG